MTRIPKCADLILNKVSGAPGFWIGDVIVMAGVPSIMQAMLDEVAPKLKIGIRMLSETVRADAREGDIVQLGEIAKANPAIAIGSFRSSIRSTGPIRMSSCAPAMHRSLRKTRGRGHAGASPASTIK
jgi:molybdopterin-biosynthesis enzyme MoeA-like protein